MSIFYAGRNIVSPAVLSQVNDSAMYNPNGNVGNILAVIGSAVAGKPNTALRFGSPEDARATLVSGPLLDAVVRGFNPSAETLGPSEVIAVRVDPATRATLDLLNASAQAVINLASTDYGVRTNQIKVKVESGTTRGFKLTTQYEQAINTVDDVYRAPLKVRYTGAQSTARISIDGTTVTLEAPNSTPVATIALGTYGTVQQLVDRINAVPDFTAQVLDGQGATPTLNALDGATNQDVKTADYTVLANLQAVVDWFNGTGESYVTATRAAGAVTVPANIAFTYMAGAVDGTVTNSEWSAAFATLQSEDVQWVVPCSSDPSIHAMTDAHVAFMSGPAGRERRAIVGAPLGTTETSAIALAKAIASERTSLTHLGGYDYDAFGALKLYPPYVVAAMVAGGFAGQNPGTPMTNKSLKLQGMERKLRNPTDTDALIQGGVLAVESTPTGYRVVQSISTWLTDRNYNNVEQSVGFALDFTARTLRDAVAPLKGSKASPATLGEAKSRAETALKALSQAEPVGPGVLVGDANSPAYRGLTARLVGDRIAIQVQVSPGLPANYITIDIFAVPYSGAVSI